MSSAADVTQSDLFCLTVLFSKGQFQFLFQRTDCFSPLRFFCLFQFQFQWTINTMLWNTVHWVTFDLPLCTENLSSKIKLPKTLLWRPARSNSYPGVRRNDIKHPGFRITPDKDPGCFGLLPFVPFVSWLMTPVTSPGGGLTG